MRFIPKSWSRQQKVRAGSLAASILVAIATAIGGVAMTNASFSHTSNGAITGNLGSIQATDSGGTGADGIDYLFKNQLPNEKQTATVHHKNTGKNAQDVWLTFPNATALSALNNLGTYGYIQVTVGNDVVFTSENLNDRAATCGTFSPSGCWPLPDKVQLASNLAVGQLVTAKITFKYAEKLTSQLPAGTDAPFNTYPVAGQTTVKASDGTGSGLPIAVVATQRGKTP